MIKEYLPSGRVIFEDNTYLDNIDTVIYCTGYKASFPFWNVENNGRELWDYKKNKLVKNYLHTFFHDFHTLGIVGVSRVLTFRSFEYQSISLARLLSGRQAKELPTLEEQERWEREREREVMEEKRNFHDIVWESGETMKWLGQLYEIAGLGLLTGEGRVPPVFNEKVRWAIEHLRKYPEPEKDGQGKEAVEMRNTMACLEDDKEGEWVVVHGKTQKDLLAFI